MAVHSLQPRPGTVHGRFNRDLPPVLTIDPGDTVIFATLDPSWGAVGRDEFGEPAPETTPDPTLDTGHALTGPIAVRGAMPGDVLEVRIGAIRPGRWGWTAAGPMPQRPRQYNGVTERAFFGWELDADAGVAADRQGHNLHLPLRPFMGVMGNAPGEPGDHSTAPPRRVGGNLDCKELVAGSTLWLPVEVEGALFSVGDGHGTQGNGEVSGTAIECPMERVELTFTLRRDLPIDGPQAETPAGYLTMGLGATLDDATEHALDAMLKHLMRTGGWSRPEAAIVASLVADLAVTQIVNGTVGVHAVLPPDTLR